MTINKHGPWQLCLGNKIVSIAKEDIYIVKAVEDGISKDEDLVRLIAETEEIDEISAAFGLAQFLLDYSDFIAEDNSHYIITN
ncbi:MAG: hypothetical protein RSE61_07255 [Anaerovoracaceae bacterium]